MAIVILEHIARGKVSLDLVRFAGEPDGPVVIDVDELHYFLIRYHLPLGPDKILAYPASCWPRWEED